MQVLCFSGGASNESGRAAKSTYISALLRLLKVFLRLATQHFFVTWEGVRDESRRDNMRVRETPVIRAKHSLHDRPISSATKANETNYLHDFTVALQTDNSTWILL